MAVMEVALPSGYTADVDALPAVTRAREVKRIETSDSDTNVIIYMDRVSFILYKDWHKTDSFMSHRSHGTNYVSQYLLIERSESRITSQFLSLSMITTIDRNLHECFTNLHLLQPVKFVKETNVDHRVTVSVMERTVTERQPMSLEDRRQRIQDQVFHWHLFHSCFWSWIWSHSHHFCISSHYENRVLLSLLFWLFN